MPDDRFPAIPVGGAVEEEILEGEIVSETDETPAVPLRVIRSVQVVVQHPATRTTGRHMGYIPLGAMIVVKRLWEARSSARYERMIRGAEAAGDHEAALNWDKQRIAFLKDRHDRRMDWLEKPVHVALLLPKLGLYAFGVLAAIGVLLAIATRHIAEVAVPVEVTANIVKWVFIAVSVSYGPFLLGAPWIALVMLWHVGRTASGGSAGWSVARKQDEEGGLVITADTVVLGLQNLPIPELKKAFKEDWRPVFTLLPVRDGRGYSYEHSVPLGVTAQMIADRRPVLARNLHRAEVEVWPTEGERAGYVANWVADPGVLSKPAPEYPLMHEGTADVFEGVPGGVVARGDEALIPVVSNNFVAGGQQGQGKSNACRVFVLGCALDPLAEIDVFVFANNGDFDAYRPRLARYRKGVEDDTILAAVERLHELYAEVGRREGRLAELGAKKVSRGLAQAHRDLRPLVVLFSECHELFGHPEYGAIAAELATKTIKRARKTAVTLMFDTQSSRKEAIPPKLVELVSVNCCFYVKTWRSNDGFLGDGSFAAGIRATELRPGRDRGTSVITGVSDAQFELVKWYLIEVDDDTGYDAAAEVIARAVAQVAPGTPVEAVMPVDAIEVRDLLDDLDEVTRGEDGPVRIADLPPRLRKLAPSYGEYRSLTGVRLIEQIDDEGVRWTRTRNVPRLDPADLRRVLAEREVS